MEEAFFTKESWMDGRIATIDHLSIEDRPRKKGYSHHDSFEIYHFLDGDVAFTVEGTVIDITPGDILIVSRHLMHRVILKNPCRYHRKHIWFQEDVFLMPQAEGLLLRNRIVKQGVIKLGSRAAEEAGLYPLFEAVMDGIKSNTPYGGFCAVVSLLQLLICVERHSALHGGPLAEIRNEKVHEILRYIDTHIGEDLDYKTIARKFYISPKNLYRIFKKETGLSPGRYISARRIIKAKLFLSGGCSAAEAAEKVGYRDYSVFYRNFVRATGTAPSDFAKTAGEKQK